MLAEELHKRSQNTDNPLTQKEAAKQLKVGERTVKQAAAVKTLASPEIQKQVESGKLSLRQAADSLEQAKKNLGVSKSQGHVCPLNDGEKKKIQKEQKRILANTKPKTTKKQPATVPNKDSDKDATTNQQGVGGQEDMLQPPKYDKDFWPDDLNTYFECLKLRKEGSFDGKKLRKATRKLEAAVDGLSRADTLFTETLEAARVCHDLNNAIDAVSKHTGISVKSLNKMQLAKQKFYDASRQKIADAVEFIGGFEKLYETLLGACATSVEQGLLIEIQQKFHEQRTAFCDSYRSFQKICNTTPEVNSS